MFPWPRPRQPGRQRADERAAFFGGGGDEALRCCLVFSRRSRGSHNVRCGGDAGGRAPEIGSFLAGVLFLGWFASEVAAHDAERILDRLCCWFVGARVHAQMTVWVGDIQDKMVACMIT